ncbi:MAG: alpha/beta hydrolase [Pseudomonadota bacterium]
MSTASDLRVVADDGTELMVRRCGNTSGPRLLVGHGVGFAVDGFCPMWRHLEPVCDLVLMDLRGHGRSSPVTPESIDGPRVMEDTKSVVRAIKETWGERPLWGVFHSYSGLTALRLEAIDPGWFAGLFLMEPPAMPPPDHPAHAAFDQGRQGLAERTLKRQATFGSVGELVEKYAGRKQFSRFAPGSTEALAASLLVPDGDGLRLACAPAVEAQFYATNRDDGLWQRLDTVACPIMMLAGGDDMRDGVPPALTARDLAHAGGFDFVEVAGTTHMMVLERPRFIAELARAFVMAHQDG